MEIKGEDTLQISGVSFSSRLFLGTGKFSSGAVMRKAIEASGTSMVTVALKRVEWHQKNEENILSHIPSHIRLLPNTSGARNAAEAVMAARLAADALETRWVKLEIHPDPKYLLPDPIETLKATEQLAKEGFIVLPYVHADPVLCKQLEEAGASAVMPLGSPIGSNKGIRTADFIEIIIDQAQVPVIVDAGIGMPSHAAYAMELGADAVLINTAIAVARNPVCMAEAFRDAVTAGRKAYLHALSSLSKEASPSSPFTEFLSKLNE